LGGTGWIDTAGGRLPRLPHQVCATFGAALRHVPGAARRRPLLFHDADDLGDDVAGALDDDVVPRPHIFASYLILVVQRGAANRHPTDLDRRQPGDRGDGAGSPDIDLDVLDDGLGLLGW